MATGFSRAYPASQSALRRLAVLIAAPFVLCVALSACANAAPTIIVEPAATLSEPLLDAPIAIEPVSAVGEQFPSMVPGAPLPVAWAVAPSLRAVAPPAPAIGGVAAVVIDEASMAVLYEKDAHVSLPPASLTKIVTLILALEHGDVDAWVDVDVDSTSMRGSTVMGLLPGDRFTLRDLLYGLMLPSGNDAALAIARYVAGSDEAFVASMNDLTRRLGLTESNFLNPHGLGGRDHRSSPFDMALLARYGMSLPGFYDVVTTRYYVARGSRTIQLGNINTFLGSYTGADGIKTGYTRSAGPTIAVSAMRNGHRLFAVVLNSQSRDNDGRVLLNWAFANHTWPE